MKYKKIKYKETLINVLDMSITEIVHEIDSNGSIKVITSNIINKKGKKEKEVVNTVNKQIKVDLVNKFVNDVLDILASPIFDGYMIDDASGNLEIDFDDDALKIKVDRAVYNNNNSIGSLFIKLMKKAN